MSAANPKTERCCGLCEFFTGYWFSEPYPMEFRGECHRFPPPRPSGFVTLCGDARNVPESWCGEFKKRKR